MQTIQSFLQRPDRRVSMSISAPIADLREVVNGGKFISSFVDHEQLHLLGVNVIRNVFSASTIEKYIDSYFRQVGEEKIRRTPFHPTEMKIDDGNFLQGIVKEPEFLKLAASFFDGNVGIDFTRIVRKDKHDVRPVILHQDTGYQMGGSTGYGSYSLFIALTQCSYENGGLIFYPGTHHFGYLGDVGEIADILPPDYPVIHSHAEPGDVVCMNSAVWHASPENKALSDRVYLEVHIQHIDEPTTRIPVCGTVTSKYALHMNVDDIFKSSRAQRLRQLYQEVESLKDQLALRTDGQSE